MYYIKCLGINCWFILMSSSWYVPGTKDLKAS
jgi:hypothetical protein